MMSEEYTSLDNGKPLPKNVNGEVYSNVRFGTDDCSEKLKALKVGYYSKNREKFTSNDNSNISFTVENTDQA